MLLNSSYFSKAKNNMVINIISYIFLGIIIYLFMWDFKIVDTFQIFIFFIISFAISMFIFDKFKFSNNKFIKILQKFVFINSILVIIGLILYLFYVSIFNTVFCDSDSESEGENKKAVEKYNANPNEYNKTELERQTQKLDKFYEEIKKLDIRDTLSSLYNKYK